MVLRRERGSLAVAGGPGDIRPALNSAHLVFRYDCLWAALSSLACIHREFDAFLYANVALLVPSFEDMWFWGLDTIERKWNMRRTPLGTRSTHLCFDRCCLFINIYICNYRWYIYIASLWFFLHSLNNSQYNRELDDDDDEWSSSTARIRDVVGCVPLQSHRQGGVWLDPGPRLLLRAGHQQRDSPGVGGSGLSPLPPNCSQKPQGKIQREHLTMDVLNLHKGFYLKNVYPRRFLRTKSVLKILRRCCQEDCTVSFK